ncbi:hypothetical protein [Paenibacillus abyssi]|uniref:Uncharacterized protein n=1 Tax=Paenibacillus abyssi TaxID=1340531 RepID=A0A917CSQ3_9BACL|nr:hypothetical protein [Paenibacillus abyssi]GGF96480.1 hypothetical protein GCM10010916_12150 [Paenibacillus abyssi]
MDKAQRIQCLREAENDCYRICFHLLQSEHCAAEAAKEALLRLYRQDHFFTSASHEQRLKLVKAEAVRSSMDRLTESAMAATVS